MRRMKALRGFSVDAVAAVCSSDGEVGVLLRFASPAIPDGEVTFSFTPEQAALVALMLTNVCEDVVHGPSETRLADAERSGLIVTKEGSTPS